MGIDQAGGRRTAVQVDTLRMWARETLNVVIGTNGQNAAATNRDGLRDVVCRIHRDNPAIR
jgi:hypothetical protein